jgi:hypothetical protein
MKEGYACSRPVGLPSGLELAATAASSCFQRPENHMVFGAFFKERVLPWKAGFRLPRSE